MVESELQTINLVRGRKQEIGERRAVKVKVQFAAMMVLIVFMGSVLFLYAVKVYASQSLKSVTADIKKEEAAIVRKQTLEAKYRILVNKLGLVERFLAENETIYTWLETVYQGLGPGIALSGVEINNADMTISMQVIALTMEQGLNYLDQIEEQVAGSADFSRVTLNGVNRNEDGSYTFEVVYSR